MSNSMYGPMAKNLINCADKIGYKAVVYDLGGLKLGKPFIQNIREYRKNKNISFPGGWLYKIDVIKDFLHSKHERFVYIDSDAVIIKRIDEIWDEDYDIGVTVRPQEDIDQMIGRFGKLPIFGGYINAGVMFFRNTEATARFIERWAKDSEKYSDDQSALNSLLKSFFPLRPEQTIHFDDIAIRTFDARIYNYYFCDGTYNIKEAKILHFKSGIARKLYDRYFNPPVFYIKKIWNSAYETMKRIIKNLIEKLYRFTKPYKN